MKVLLKNSRKEAVEAMKRYIIETDVQKIWSYKAEDVAAGFACKLMEPHGDKSYAMEDRADYWEWFEEAICLLQSDEVDICFLYPEEAQTEFEQFFEMKPQFCHPRQTSWTVTEVERFFHEYRERTIREEIRYEEQSRRLTFLQGQVFLTKGLNDDGLAVSALQTREAQGASVSERKEKPKAESKVKVYAPLPRQRPAHETTAAQSKAAKKPEAKKEEKIPKGKDEPPQLPKVNHEDFRRYIEERVEGQCNTVAYRMDDVNRD